MFMFNFMMNNHHQLKGFVLKLKPYIVHGPVHLR